MSFAKFSFALYFFSFVLQLVGARLLADERYTQAVLLLSADGTFHATRLPKANLRNKVLLPKIMVVF